MGKKGKGDWIPDPGWEEDGQGGFRPKRDDGEYPKSDYYDMSPGGPAGTLKTYDHAKKAIAYRFNRLDIDSLDEAGRERLFDSIDYYASRGDRACKDIKAYFDWEENRPPQHHQNFKQILEKADFTAPRLEQQDSFDNPSNGYGRAGGEFKPGKGGGGRGC